MGSIILSMLLVVCLGAFVLGAVAMGMRGKGRRQHPRIANTLAHAAMALNGDGEPPSSLQRVFS